MGMVTKNTGGKKQAGSDGEGIFALHAMRKEGSTRFISLNYDKLAANLGLPEGRQASVAALEMVKAIAKEHYGEGMREWGTASESKCNYSFSKEGTPSVITVTFEHKLELFTVKTFGVPDELHQKIDAALSKKKSE